VFSIIVLVIYMVYVCVFCVVFKFGGLLCVCVLWCFACGVCVIMVCISGVVSVI